MKPLRLGITIDHAATLRNARGGEHPCPIRAAKLALEAGADSITAHLRKDRRHIKDCGIEVADLKHLNNIIANLRSKEIVQSVERWQA